MTNSTTLPQLAPPGAGIPTIERLVGGTLLKLRCRISVPAHFTAQFQRERQAIARLYTGPDATALSARVLIPRLRGLEDSSRFWSVWMTLDHLRIVNDSITGVIDDLTHGRVPSATASTAAVKPDSNVGSDVVAAYEASCVRFLVLNASRPSLRTKLRYAHPWFGPLDAAEWHAMAGMHMAIHRVQIERIFSLAQQDTP